MRGETTRSVSTIGTIAISIHSPHARGDPQRPRGRPAKEISIHSPHARGDNFACAAHPAHVISIHSPHARGDYGSGGGTLPWFQFQSTPLMRGETGGSWSGKSRRMYFNPLPSCEGRRCRQNHGRKPKSFQSTPLMRGETVFAPVFYSRKYISIHSPHARGDVRVNVTPKYPFISIHSPHARGDAMKKAK